MPKLSSVLPYPFCINKYLPLFCNISCDPKFDTDANLSKGFCNFNLQILVSCRQRLVLLDIIIIIKGWKIDLMDQYERLDLF